MNFIKRCLRNWFSLLAIAINIAAFTYLILEHQWVGLIGWVLSLTSATIANQYMETVKAYRETVSQQKLTIDSWRRLYYHAKEEYPNGSSRETSKAAN